MPHIFWGRSHNIDWGIPLFGCCGFFFGFESLFLYVGFCLFYPPVLLYHVCITVCFIFLFRVLGRVHKNLGPLGLQKVRSDCCFSGGFGKKTACFNTSSFSILSFLLCVCSEK